MLLLANPVESFNASKVKVLYKPELTSVAALIFILYKRLISEVPLAAASNTRKVESLIAVKSPIFQSFNRIWFDPEAPMTPSLRYANILVALVTGSISKILCTLEASPIIDVGYSKGL